MVTIHVISDSLGNTAKKIVQAALVQFDYAKVEYKLLKNANIQTTIQLERVFEYVKHEDIVVITLVNPELVHYAKKLADTKQVVIIDLLTQLLAGLEHSFHLPAEQKPGLSRKMGQEYFKRVEAVEFAVKYDDGKDTRGIEEADIVLLGVSRTSKTPLSLYLAHKNIKVLNIPIIKGMILPDVLYRIDKRKIIGLTNSVETLNHLRSERMKTMGLYQVSEYTDEQHIFEELEYALSLMTKIGCPIINVENKAIEETADLILEIIAQQR